MSRTKVHFQKDYQCLLSEVVNQIKNNTVNNFNHYRYHLNTNSNFYTPANNSSCLQKHDQSIQRKQIQTKLLNNQIQPLKQTTFYAFGQSSPTKSLQMRKTFVNLGNNRYLINRNSVSLNKSSNYGIQNFIESDKNNFNINNLTFPILNQSNKNRKTLLPLNSNNMFHQTNNSMSKSIKFSFTKRKNINKPHSLQINNRKQGKVFQQFQNKFKNNPQQHLITPTKSQFNMDQIQRRLRVQTNDYLKQVAFSNEYQKKLLQMERNIVMKRRIQKLKLNKAKIQANQKDKIDAWKHQITLQNQPDQLEDVFDQTKNKPLF